VKDSWKELNQIINGARMAAVMKKKTPMSKPAENELWMCHHCQSLFGQAKKLTKTITCDECWESVETERMFFNYGA
jgi:protein-arginine kinase activator protein McsA